MRNWIPLAIALSLSSADLFAGQTPSRSTNEQTSSKTTRKKNKKELELESKAQNLTTSLARRAHKSPEQLSALLDNLITSNHEQTFIDTLKKDERIFLKHKVDLFRAALRWSDKLSLAIAAGSLGLVQSLVQAEEQLLWKPSTTRDDRSSKWFPTWMAIFWNRADIYQFLISNYAQEPKLYEHNAGGVRSRKLIEHQVTATAGADILTLFWQNNLPSDLVKEFKDALASANFEGALWYYQKYTKNVKYSVGVIKGNDIWPSWAISEGEISDPGFTILKEIAKCEPSFMKFDSFSMKGLLVWFKLAKLVYDDFRDEDKVFLQQKIADLLKSSTALDLNLKAEMYQFLQRKKAEAASRAATVAANAQASTVPSAPPQDNVSSEGSVYESEPGVSEASEGGGETQYSDNASNFWGVSPMLLLVGGLIKKFLIFSKESGSRYESSKAKSYLDRALNLDSLEVFPDDAIFERDSFGDLSDRVDLSVH